MESKVVKSQSFVVIAGFAFMIAMLAFVASNQRMSPNATMQQVAFFAAAAGLALCASLAWTWFKLLPRAELGQAAEPVPARTFQTNLIIALAMAEVPSVLGFGVGSVLREFRFLFFAASLAVVLLAVLPATLRYWNLVEEKPL